ncbi:MAG: TonB-dependent receptor [Thiohalobacteraceae bacterium]
MGQNSKSTYLGASCAALALAAILPAGQQALAQDAGNPAETGSEGGLSEIVVTAQHREENQQDVPISITAITADTLGSSGVSATSDLSQVVPAVQMTRIGPSGLFFVRGVGTTNAAAGEEGANAFYVDGVYIPDLAGTVNNFNNIARVEVLKGPQGTLFGRNASGGLIHIITRDPDGDETIVKGKVGYANYETVSGQLYASTPLTQNLAVDLALMGQDQGKGWGRNLTRNVRIKTDDHWGARSKAVLRLDDVKFTLGGDYYRIKDDTILAWRIDESNLGSGRQVPPTGYNTTANYPSLTDIETWGVNLNIEADLGFATLTSISAVRNSRNETYFDIDGGPLPLVQFDYVSRSKSFQQELRLASTSTEPLSWQLGVFYLDTKASNFQEQRGSAFAGRGRLGQDIDGSITTDSYAAFGEVTYALTPTTHVTGGLRYTRDERDFEGIEQPYSLPGTPLAPITYPRPGVDKFSSSLKKGNLTYRLALRQDLGDDVNVYASMNRGFKSGSYNLQSFSNPPTKPQFITAYEVGVKSELFDRRLRLNIAAYHYDISDYQVRSRLDGTTVLLNAAAVKVDGIDIDFEAAPIERFKLFGGITLLKSRFEDFEAGLYYYPSPAVCTVPKPGASGPGVIPGSTTGPVTGGLTECYGDTSGNRTPLAPKFTASLGASYTVPINTDGHVQFTAQYSYNSGYFYETENRLRQDSYGILNGAIELRLNERWGVEVWGRNLTDTRYFGLRSSSSTGAYASYAAPRTYGVDLKFDF